MCLGPENEPPRAATLWTQLSTNQLHAGGYAAMRSLSLCQQVQALQVAACFRHEQPRAVLELLSFLSLETEVLYLQ